MFWGTQRQNAKYVKLAYILIPPLGGAPPTEQGGIKGIRRIEKIGRWKIWTVDNITMGGFKDHSIKLKADGLSVRLSLF